MTVDRKIARPTVGQRHKQTVKLTDTLTKRQRGTDTNTKTDRQIHTQKAANRLTQQPDLKKDRLIELPKKRQKE